MVVQLPLLIAIIIALVGAVTGKWGFIALAFLLFLPTIIGGSIGALFVNIPTIVWVIVILVIIFIITGGKKRK